MVYRCDNYNTGVRVTIASILWEDLSVEDIAFASKQDNRLFLRALSHNIVCVVLYYNDELQTCPQMRLFCIGTEADCLRL